ncbi:MAG: RdgB/HAM1 family non-canonical purine NTP pyrophosphatase [Prevotella sp.]|nr:RdgB/HAM1 family non-canonical purine NTP pyrophosphatase [Prevotella sp.]
MKIVFATNNQHKLEEVRQILGDRVEVLSLNDIGCHIDIPETGTTLKENALQKAQYVYDHYHIDCFADDTGLEVDALGGAPGVFSARYAAMQHNDSVLSGSAAGKSHDSEANMARLLRELGDNNNRRARFRTVIALIQKVGNLNCVERINFFEGIVEGEITRERSGVGGFGYDPIFRPDGYDKTFAELGNEVKNQISHRARATAKLCAFLLNK